MDNSRYAFFLLLFFVTGERNARFETFSFQHAEPESHSSFAAVTNVNAMSRPTHSTSSQVNQKYITALTEISTELYKLIIQKHMPFTFNLVLNYNTEHFTVN